MTLPVTTVSGDRRDAGARGWQLAHWAVANASELHIRSVSYAGREWVAGHTDSRWRPVDGKGSAGPGGEAEAVRSPPVSSPGCSRAGVRVITRRRWTGPTLRRIADSLPDTRATFVTVGR